MSENLELIKFTRLYLGQTNWEYIKKTSKEELELFKSTPIDLNRSYFVLGNPELLNKYKAFYLTRCVKKRPLYSQYFMDEYASALSSSTKDEFGLNIDQDLIFLYKNNHEYSFGNSETWLRETVLNKVTNRNRDGLITVILSEIRMPILEESGELEVINLAGGATSIATKKILESASIKEIIDGDCTVY